LTIVKQMLDNCQVPGDGKSTPMAWGEYATGHGGHAERATSAEALSASRAALGARDG
jgi:hypothetical protein